MYVAGLKLGQERAVSFTNTPFPIHFLFHGQTYKSIRPEEAEDDNTVNIIHRHLPPNFDKLKNTVFFAHGTPLYIMEKDESLEAVTEFIHKCDIILTSWPSHIPYWQQFTNKPVIYNQPGVDLDYFTADGPKKDAKGKPLVLWADSWRGDKQPWNILYAMKLVAKQLPEAKLKMVNIPENKRLLVARMIQALGLQPNVEFPIDEKVKDVREWYRSADLVVSAVNSEGNNVSWEAEACNVPVIQTAGADIQLIKSMIIMSYFTRLVTKHRDINDTVTEQARIFREQFNVS